MKLMVWEIDIQIVTYFLFCMNSTFYTEILLCDASIAFLHGTIVTSCWYSTHQPIWSSTYFLTRYEKSNLMLHLIYIKSRHIVVFLLQIFKNCIQTFQYVPTPRYRLDDDLNIVFIYT